MIGKIRLIFLLLTAGIAASEKLFGNSPLTVAQPSDLLKWKLQNLKSVDQEIIEVVENVSMENILKLKNVFNVSDACLGSLEQLALDSLELESYAIQMLDSWGKLGSGVLEGHLNWPGRYYECRNAKNKNGTIIPKYYTSYIGYDPTPLAGMFLPGLSVGGCFPSNCSLNDINNVLYKLVNITNIPGVLAFAQSPENVIRWGAAERIGVTVCSTLVLLVVISTLYEYISLNKFAPSVKTESDSQDLISTSNQQPGKLYKLAISFSVISNTRILLNTEQKPGQINCLHGMRFLSMSWVLLGHSYVFSIYSTDNIVFTARYFVDHFGIQAITNATYSVDSFFYLSGLLVAYLGLREMRRNEGKINVLLMYLYRYIRLTPAYALVILIVVSIYPMLGDGPMWPQEQQDLKQLCDVNWWGNLLYINNLYPENTGKQCIVWSWYLANDFQFYILAPLFLYSLYRFPKLGLSLVTFCLTASIAITGGFSAYTNQQPTVLIFAQLSKLVLHPNIPTNTTTPQYSPYINDLYMKPWCRLGAYLVGMLTGYILYINNNKVKMSKVTVVIGWVSASIMNLAIVYGLYPAVEGGYVLDNNTAAFYNAVSRPLWCIGLAWLTVACVSGYGGPVNTLLSWKAFIPLSRLTYCVYLVHPLVIYWLLSTVEVFYHNSIAFLLMMFFTTLVMATMIAYALSMLIEAPVSAIMKIAFNKSSSPQNSAISYVPVNKIEQPVIDDGQKLA
ncbi:nose resistant to fluoxetine protein 6-like [Ciona intestinalis]